MPEDWESVAEAITSRMQTLDMKQVELAEKSKVSLALVRELQRNTAQRRRSKRTLEALSLALGWHPRHLEAVANGRRPPAPGDPDHHEEGDGTSDRISALEEKLDTLSVQVAEMNDNLMTLIDNVRENRRR